MGGSNFLLSGYYKLHVNVAQGQGCVNERIVSMQKFARYKPDSVELVNDPAT
jgi:hypothetical protein